MLFSRKYVYEDGLLKIWQLKDEKEDLKEKISVIKDEIKTVDTTEKLVEYEISTNDDDTLLDDNPYDKKPFAEVKDEKPFENYMSRESTSLFSNNVKYEIVYTCSLCEHVFPSKYFLKKHKRKHNICHYCKSRFKSSKAVENHKKGCVFKYCMTSRAYVKVSNIAESDKMKSLYRQAFERANFPHLMGSLTIKTEPRDMEYEEIPTNEFSYYFDKKTIVKSEPLDNFSEESMNDHQNYAENVKTECFSNLGVLISDQTPLFDLPTVQSPQLDLPTVLTPQSDLPPVLTPQLDLPTVLIPQLDLPIVQTPQLDLPIVQTPQFDLPTVLIPQLDLPTVQTKLSPASVKSPDVGWCSDGEESEKNQRFSRFKSELEEIASQKKELEFFKKETENAEISDGEINSNECKDDKIDENPSTDTLLSSLPDLINVKTESIKKISESERPPKILKVKQKIETVKKSIKLKRNVDNNNVIPAGSETQSSPKTSPKCSKQEKPRYVRLTDKPNMNLFIY